VHPPHRVHADAGYRRVIRQGTLRRRMLMR
jgi:hypothetical protein